MAIKYMDVGPQRQSGDKSMGRGPGIGVFGGGQWNPGSINTRNVGRSIQPGISTARIDRRDIEGTRIPLSVGRGAPISGGTIPAVNVVPQVAAQKRRVPSLPSIIGRIPLSTKGTLPLKGLQRKLRQGRQVQSSPPQP